jgi:hypothetical protein
VVGESSPQLAEKHNGVWNGCWFTWFHPACAEKGVSPWGNRAYKERLVRESKAHAALVFDGDVGVAWCEYGSPDELPNIYHLKEYNAGLDTAPDNRLTCFFVDRNERSKGKKPLRDAYDDLTQLGHSTTGQVSPDTRTSCADAVPRREAAVPDTVVHYEAPPSGQH